MLFCLDIHSIEHVRGFFSDGCRRTGEAFCSVGSPDSPDCLLFAPSGRPTASECHFFLRRAARQPRLLTFCSVRPPDSVPERFFTFAGRPTAPIAYFLLRRAARQRARAIFHSVGSPDSVPERFFTLAGRPTACRSDFSRSRAARQHYRPICRFSRRMRRTLWSMRCSVSTPSSTALTTASKASTKFCGPSTMSAPAWSVPTAASPFVY